ncbi:hypothetical protein M1146_05990 [Patescibacteria group bacterium]|nr:hypothetical protein [Patescibacteria group bacterium]
MIDPLTINLLDKTKSNYNKARAEAIAHDVSTYSWTKDRAEADWDKNYPNGFDDWVANRTSLNARGEQRVIDKLNEVIALLNELEKYPEAHEILEHMLEHQGGQNG